MHRRKYLKTAGLAGIAGVSGCAGLGGGDGSGPINIGALEPQSGPIGAPFAEPHMTGLEIALEDASENLDRELQLVVTDTQSDPQEADSAFRRHVEQDDVVAVTGAVSSDVGIRMAQVAEELQIPNFLNQAGAEEILSRDSQFTFRVGWLPAPTHARSDIEFAISRDFTNIGVIIADYAWGRAYEANMQEQVPDDVSLQIEAAPTTESDFRPYLRQFPDEMDALSFTGHPVGVFSGMAQAFELDIGVPIIDGSPPQGLIIDTLGENVTNDVIGHTVADIESQEYQQLGERVAEREGRAMYNFEVYGYVTGRMIGEAVAEVGPNPTDIADYVRTTTFDYAIYNNPIQYTEWGELDQPIHAYFDYIAESPAYYPDADYSLNLLERTEPLAPYDPGS